MLYQLIVPQTVMLTLGLRLLKRRMSLKEVDKKKKEDNQKRIKQRKNIISFVRFLEDW